MAINTATWAVYSCVKKKAGIRTMKSQHSIYAPQVILIGNLLDFIWQQEAYFIFNFKALSTDTMNLI